jgi:hypothetical protein
MIAMDVIDAVLQLLQHGVTAVVWWWPREPRKPVRILRLPRRPPARYFALSGEVRYPCDPGGDRRTGAAGGLADDGN